MLRISPIILFASLSVAQQYASEGHASANYLPPGRFDLIALADVDGDGDLDAVLDDPWTGFSFARRTGPHMWTSTLLFPTVIGDAVWADFDRDGDPDLLVGSAVALVVGVPAGILRNDGATFTWTGQIAGTLSGDTKGIAVGDIDGDGAPDAILGTSLGMQVLHNNGAGVLTAVPGSLVTNHDVHPVLFDRDGDGDLDLAAATSTGLVLLDNTSGVFTNLGNPLPPFASPSTGIVAGDFDLDGRVDLAFESPSLDVLWNDPTGWQHAPSNGPALLTYSRVHVADLDVDGLPDLVLPTAAGIDWLRNLGNRAFDLRPAMYPAGNVTATGLTVGDISGDGTIDVVAAWSDSAITVLHGAAPQPFLDPATQFRALPARANNYGNLAAVGDVDADGRDDLVIPNPPQVLRRDQDGIWTNQPIGDARTTYQRAWLTDLDGDGDLDLLLTLSYAPQPPAMPMQRFTNDGAGNFTFAQDLVVSYDTNALHFTDLDGDGDVDMLAAAGQGRVGWIENQGAAGFVDAGLLSSVPAGSGNSLIVADFDGDGHVDLACGTSPVGMPVYVGDGLGGFTVGGSIPVVSGGIVQQMVAGDLDGDGDLDVIARESLSSGSQRALFRNDGTATFTRVSGAFPAAYSLGGMQLFDMDGDGDLDLFSPSNPGSLFRNDGTGVFTDASARLVVSGAYQNNFFDFDDDGDVDLVYVEGGQWRRAPNRLRDAASVQPVHPGGQLRVSLAAVPEVPGPNTVFLPCFSFGSGPSVVVPGLAGRLQLSAATASLVTVLPAPTGSVTWSANIPASPAFVGLELCTQAIVLGPHVPPGFTNMVYERVLP